jgi:ABC-type bacteriocin/lantibiotic exporter with double-glycine peptidase domain
VKEFWIYTGLRVLLFVATLAVVFGVWLLLSDEVPVLWAVVVAFAISGLASYFLLERSRQAFAQKVEGRAERVSAAFEAQRSKEDVDDETP